MRMMNKPFVFAIYTSLFITNFVVSNGFVAVSVIFGEDEMKWIIYGLKLNCFCWLLGFRAVSFGTHYGEVESWIMGESIKLGVYISEIWKN